MENTDSVRIRSKILYVVVTLLPMAIFMALYMPAFFLVEGIEPADGFHIIHTPVDDMIPFCEAFIIPYMLWLPYLIIGSVAIGIKSRFFSRTTSYMLMTGMVLFIVISLIYPNALELRCEAPDRENIFMSMVRYLYEIDTPTNVLPSLHVFDVLCVASGIHLSFPKRKLLQILNDIFVVLVILSTMFIKQHSIIDVLSAWLLYILVFLLFLRIRGTEERA